MAIKAEDKTNGSIKARRILIMAQEVVVWTDSEKGMDTEA